MKVIFLDIDGVLNTPSSESRCGEYIGIDDEKVTMRDAPDNMGIKNLETIKKRGKQI